MTRSSTVLVAAVLCMAAPDLAAAQTMYDGPPDARYGGGFIELLMTGRDPAPRSAGRPGYGPGRADEPEGGRRRMAALPGPAGTAATLAGPGPEFSRQTVSYDGPEAPGTIVIDTPSRFLYLVEGGGQAIRYGIGVGRPGFEWSGTKAVTAKREWPDWTPPAQMLRRRPDLPRHMAGGPDNPLGARALYLGSSLYRIHGTNEPGTIGQNVSSGCIRMMNEDVTDLYERVRVGTRVRVI